MTQIMMIHLQMKLKTQTLIGIILSLTAPVHAAPITFATAENMTADNNVSTTGSLVYAYNWTAAARTVNGVTFAVGSSPNSGTNLTLAGLPTVNNTAFTIGSGDFNNLSAAYKALVVGSAYGSTATTATVTMNNLVVGSKYVVQAWVSDPRGGSIATRIQTIASAGGNSQSFDFNSTNAGGGVGQFVIGTFTADATTQSFTLASTGTNLPQLNALQLRDVSGIWSGEVSAVWDESTTNFSGLSFSSVKALTNNVAFSDTSESGAAVTNSNITLAAGGVNGTNFGVNVNASTVGYTFTGADAIGLTGSIRLSKSGAGSLTLGGTNTFTGATTLTGGTLTLAHSGALQASPLTITGGTLAFNGITSTSFISLAGNQPLVLTNTSAAAVDLSVGAANTSTTYSGAISGAGSLTKIGTGKLTLSGANTHAGGTIGNGGKLSLLGSHTGLLTLAGADLDQANAVIGTTAIGSINQSSGKIALEINAVASDLLNVTGAYTATGGSIELLPIEDVAIGVPYTLVTYGGTFTGTPAITIPTRHNVAVDYGTGANSAITVTLSGGPKSIVWTGQNGNVWELGPVVNWKDGGTPTHFYSLDAVTFDDSATTFTPAITGVLTPYDINFVNDTFDYTLTGSGSIAGIGNLTKGGDAKVTINTANTFTGSTWIDFGTLELGGTAGSLGTGKVSVYPGATLLLNHTGNFTLTNALGEGGEIVKAGTGTTTFSGPNSATDYTAVVKVNAGILKMGSRDAFGRSEGIIVASGAQVDVNGQTPGTVASGGYTYTISGNGPDGAGAITNTGVGNVSNAGIKSVILAADASIGGGGVGGSQRFDIGRANVAGIGFIDGGGHTLTKKGVGTIHIRAAATNLPEVVIEGGIANIENDAAAVGGASGHVTVKSGAQFGVFGGLTLETPITIEAGGGILQPSGAGIWTGNILLAGNANVTATASFTVNSIISDGAGSFGFTKDGANQLTLGGANTYEGGTTIAVGKVLANNNAAFGTGAVGVGTSTSAVGVDLAGGITIANPLTMGVGVTGSYGGTTGLGTLSVPITATSATWSGPITINNNVAAGGHFYTAGTGILNLTGGITSSVPVVFRAGNFVVSGGGNYTDSNLGGVLKLGGNNGLATNATVAIGASVEGTLDLNGFNQTLAGLVKSSSAATVTNTGTTPSLLTISPAAAGPFTFSGIINDGSGGVSFTKSGSGTLILNGANTYTGDTTVTSGTLTVNTTFLSDTAKVTIGAAAVLDLPHGLTDTVGQFFINGVQQVAGIWGAIGSGAPHTSDRITGTGFLNVAAGPAGNVDYDAWLAGYPVLTGGNRATSADPDGDGIINFGEFALDANPVTGTRSGKVVSKITTIGPDSFSTLTIPVLIGAIANPADLPGGELGLIKGVTKYTIQASSDLSAWTLDVSEVTPALSSGLPSLGAAYEYRTFRINTPVSGSTKGFLRVKASE